MSMTITCPGLGTVTFLDDDMPESIPFGGKLAGAEEVYSDGSSHLQVTGVTLAAITITGTLRHGTSGQSPLQKADALGAMRDSGQTCTLVWMGSSSSRRWTGKLQEFVPQIARNEEVDYSLTLFREVDGALTRAFVGGPSPAQTTADRLGTAATPATQAPIATAQTKLQAAGGK